MEFTVGVDFFGFCD